MELHDCIQVQLHVWQQRGGRLGTPREGRHEDQAETDPLGELGGLGLALRAAGEQDAG